MGCEMVAVVDGRPALRWREWVAAARKGPVAGVKALVGEWRGRESWEHWLVNTEPVLALVHCDAKRGEGVEGGGKRAKPKPQDLSEWMTDE